MPEPLRAWRMNGLGGGDAGGPGLGPAVGHASVEKQVTSWRRPPYFIIRIKTVTEITLLFHVCFSLNGAGTSWRPRGRARAWRWSGLGQWCARARSPRDAVAVW